jgi:hypothetical protein
VVSWPRSVFCLVALGVDVIFVETCVRDNLYS